MSLISYTLSLCIYCLVTFCVIDVIVMKLTSFVIISGVTDMDKNVLVMVKVDGFSNSENVFCSKHTVGVPILYGSSYSTFCDILIHYIFKGGLQKDFRICYIVESCPPPVVLMMIQALLFSCI
ncbi:unnamed protein product [Cuscuta epithymum]|uniref:Uncharacterized protein n=1 Tax=Cuscuta epithymum TaxID=186058 RepID=A0AAV0FCL3_9ASTE|nr:unnamed protein product [Cuscuta epithymum]